MYTMNISILTLFTLQLCTLFVEADETPSDRDDAGDSEIKCIVYAKRPYGKSPTFTLYGLKEKFNALLIGYDTHIDERRSNKGSLYGWSAPKAPNEEGIARFKFDLDYVSIAPQSGTPLSYCALIFSPPVSPKFDTSAVFGKPAMSTERYFGSKEHLVRALKRKSRTITECCFIAYPMASKK